jgi:phage terminase large subunit-like protein
MISSTDADDPATAYARAIVAGQLPAGRLHRLACVRHLADLEASPGTGYRFEWARADRVIRFFRLLRHFKGTGFAGKRIELQNFQIFIVASLFGWVRITDQRRRFRNAFIELPRGSGKSTLGAGLAIWLAFFDKEASADVVVCATKKDQARIIFDAGRQMLLRAPAVRRRGIEVQRHQVYAPASASKFFPLGSDVDTLDGLRPHAVFADEVHKIGDADLIDILESGMGTRQQPMLIETTTAGDEDAETGVYGAHLRLSDNVLSGDVDLPEWFAFIAAADPDDDWQDPATWKKANPSLGVSVNPDFLDKECRKAIANPQEQPKFRRLYLGQRVGADERYIPKDAWSACAHELPDDVLRGRPCLMGLDYSSKIDLTALALLWTLDDGRFYTRVHVWMPEANLLARQRRDRVPYQTWAADGHLELIPGPVIEQPIVRRRIVEEAARWGVTEIDFDPWNATELARQLTDEDGLTCVEIRQGTRTLSEPTKRLLELVLAGRLGHPNSPLLNWMTANVRVKRDRNDNVILDKQRSRSRIDGPAAIVNALSRGVRLAPVAPEPTYQLIVIGRGQR